MGGYIYKPPPNLPFPFSFSFPLKEPLHPLHQIRFPSPAIQSLAHQPRPERRNRELENRGEKAKLLVGLFAFRGGGIFRRGRIIRDQKHGEGGGRGGEWRRNTNFLNPVLVKHFPHPRVVHPRIVRIGCLGPLASRGDIVVAVTGRGPFPGRGGVRWAVRSFPG